MKMLVHIALYNSNIEIIYFDSFGVEHAPEEIKKLIGIKTTMFRIQANNSIMCEYFCVGIFVGSSILYLEGKL